MDKKFMNKMDDMELDKVAGGTHRKTPNDAGLGTLPAGLSEMGIASENNTNKDIKTVKSLTHSQECV